ncbi:MAG: hypothetical protein ACREIV_15790, partial [Planctomycetaceae bacterium]
GYMSLDLAAGTGEFLRLRGPAIEPGMPLGGARLEDVIERISLRGDGTDALHAELDSFVAAVEGQGPVAVSGDDGRRALAVALEIVNRIEANVAHRSFA